jgi:hypothetical protein
LTGKTTDLQKQFAQDAYEILANDTDTSHITVFPARCGVGKSLAVKALINFAVRQNTMVDWIKDMVGLVIITDQLNRLKEYHAVDDTVCKNIVDYGYPDLQHTHYCTYISSRDDTKTAAELLAESEYRPVVLLSTQRYFSLSDSQRERLFTYRVKGRNETIHYARRIVIFDGKPYFYMTKSLKISNLNDVSTALYQGIPSTELDKDWIVGEYRFFQEKLEDIFQKKEKIKTDEDIFYWRDINCKTITRNDERFFQIIEKYKQDIERVKPTAYADLQDFRRLMAEGAFFYTTKKHKTQSYETRFELYTDNVDKFYINKDKAKFFVFDGTADIDPDYQLPYIKMIPCEKYNIPLPLSISQYNVNTSKSHITGNNNDKILNAIKDDIIKRVGNSPTLIATYQYKKKYFDNPNMTTAHFGNLKGFNAYINNFHMAHVGLNRCHHFNYFLAWLSKNPVEYEKLKIYSEENSRDYIKQKTTPVKGVFEDSGMNDIMYKSIMVDFEQNIFRSAVRDYANTKPVTVLCYWSNEVYAPLNEMIKKRYKPYNAIIEFNPAPETIAQAKIANRKTSSGTRTAPQRIVEWFESQPKGRYFNVKEFLEETKISARQFKDAKRNKTV